MTACDWWMLTQIQSTFLDVIFASNQRAPPSECRPYLAIRVTQPHFLHTPHWDSQEYNSAKQGRPTPQLFSLSVRDAMRLFSVAMLAVLALCLVCPVLSSPGHYIHEYYRNQEETHYYGGDRSARSAIHSAASCPTSSSVSLCLVTLSFLLRP